jgi:integrase
MPTPVRKTVKNEITNKKENKSDIWWLRKKVPDQYRGVVGRREVWRSLKTTDFKEAVAKCNRQSLDLDKEWEDRLRAQTAAKGTVLPARTMTDFDLSGLQRVVHEQGREAQIRNPPAAAKWGQGTHLRNEDENDEEREYDEQALDGFLKRTGYVLTEADRRRFLPMFVEAQRQVSVDLARAAMKQDYSESDAFANNAPSLLERIDLHEAFEFYCDKAGIKGGATGATAKRWRPKIAAFCVFVGHSDLCRMTRDDAYRWVDHLTKEGVAKKSIREVNIASLRAVAGFQIERGKLKTENPFSRIRVRGVKATKDSNKKGFSDAQAETILSATLATFSHLTTPETRAARRWIPWICAYTGARVNEITSLLPSDVRPDVETGIPCFYLRPEMTKGDYERIIPVHSHLIEQKFLDYVAKRAKARLPLFYDPKRAEGGENANPQWQKVAERLGEWVVKGLKVTGVKPNHGWRHRFKSVSREVGMHPEVEAFITGHGGSDDPDEIKKVSLNYGDAWVKTLKKTIEMYPRYEISALDAPPAPLRRVRRTPAQIAAEGAASRTSRRSRSVA